MATSRCAGKLDIVGWGKLAAGKEVIAVTPISGCDLRIFTLRNGNIEPAPVYADIVPRALEDGLGVAADAKQIQAIDFVARPCYLLTWIVDGEGAGRIEIKSYVMLTAIKSLYLPA